MEGFFTRAFRSGLQPVEVGRRIQREMEENRTISVNRTYAPNDFRILIGSEDFGRFAQLKSGLEGEFSELVIDHAKKRRWNLMGLPKVELVEDGNLGKGEFRIESSLTADPDSGPRVSTRAPPELDSTHAISSTEAMSLGHSPGAELILLEDGQERDRISITRTPVTIGRLSSNDVVLSDSNVSRRHAELRSERGRWSIVDLGSTNGTVVNGKLAKEHQLRNGDRITFGTSELEFRVGGG
jgi:hypothetical protein